MKQLFKINIEDIKKTEELGETLGKLLNGGEIICMTGDLGAGKTTLSQSIAKGLDINDYVTSPTFTIINEYYGRHPLYHFDVYRINDVDEMYDLGYEDYFYGDGITIIEWANIIEDILPKERLNIDIKRGDYADSREVQIYGYGKKYEGIVEDLKRIYKPL